MDIQEWQSQQKSQISAQNTEREVRNVLQGFAAAIREGNLDKIMSYYSPEVVAFDMMPPLTFRGTENYSKSWHDFFTSYFNFPIAFDHKELEVYAAGDMAFCHTLVRMTGQSKKGEYMESWLRCSLGLKKINGFWKIVHEHNSVPLDPETGNGIMNLDPSSDTIH